MKRILITIIILIVSGKTDSFAQTIKARSSGLPVDFRVTETIQDSPTSIEFFKPEVLAATSRGFKKIKKQTIDVEGVVIDNDGVDTLKINGNRIETSRAGRFFTTLSLKEGANKITFQVIDGNNNLFSKVYEIEVEKEEEVISSNAGKYYALLIANQDYDDPEIADLNQPIADASTLKDLLLGKYAFESQNVVLMENPTRTELIDQLDILSGKVNNQDNVLIFYAGHGYWDTDSEIGYWLPSDARKTSKSAWFRNSTLRDYIREIKSNHTLLIADACFSGGIFKTRAAFSDASVGINKLHAIPSRKAMTSGALSEVPDKSIFMRYLIRRLNENNEKYISSESLFASFKIAVLNNSPNIPQYGTVQNAGDEGGDFIFIKK